MCKQTPGRERVSVGACLRECALCKLSARCRYALAAGYGPDPAAEEGFLARPPPPSTAAAAPTSIAPAPPPPSPCGRRRLRRQFSEACLPLPGEEARRDGVDSGAGFLAWRRAWGSFSEDFAPVDPAEPAG